MTLLLILTLIGIGITWKALPVIFDILVGLFVIKFFWKIIKFFFQAFILLMIILCVFYMLV